MDHAEQPPGPTPDERDWNAAREEPTAASYEAYLQAHPDGAHVEEARGAAAGLLRKSLVPAPADVSVRGRYLTLRTARHLEDDLQFTRRGLLRAAVVADFESLWVAFAKIVFGAAWGAGLTVFSWVFVVLPVLYIPCWGWFGSLLFGLMAAAGFAALPAQALAPSGLVRDQPAAWKASWFVVGMIVVAVPLLALLVARYQWDQDHPEIAAEAQRRQAEQEKKEKEEEKYMSPIQWLSRKTAWVPTEPKQGLAIAVIVGSCLLIGVAVALPVALCGVTVVAVRAGWRWLTLRKAKVAEYAALGPLPPKAYLLTVPEVRKQYLGG
jgi:hypothetical protein